MTAPIIGQCVAHYRETGEVQSLERHLLETSALASTFAQKIDLPLAGELVGLLHDLGKYSEEFQQYLRSIAGLQEQDGDDQPIDSKKQRGNVDHSSAGAQRVWEGFRSGSPANRVVGEILALCIASHYSGLIDCVDAAGADLLSRRIAKPEVLSHRDEAWAKADISVRKRYNELITSDSLKTKVRDLVADLGQTEPSKTGDPVSAVWEDTSLMGGGSGNR